MDERETFLAILRPAIEHMAKHQASGKAGPMSEIRVPDGVGFEWTTPLGFSLAVRAVGPLSVPDAGRVFDDSAVIEIGRQEPGKEIEWLVIPDETRHGELVNPERRYSAPRPNENEKAIFERFEVVLRFIDRIVVPNPT